MKTLPALGRLALVVLLLAGAPPAARADITVRLSVKFILNADGTRPDSTGGRIGTNSTFQVEVDRGNAILAATGRGFRLKVVEYVDIQPPAPAGQAADYWFTLPARQNARTIETAAVADLAVWRWNIAAINIFVNNTTSGQCMYPNQGHTISLGAGGITPGTVLHEIGHFFNLMHTHDGDPNCGAIKPPYTLTDGDELAATIADHPCLDRDGLSTNLFGGRLYAALNAQEQAQINTSWLNVMSYHQEDQLLAEQMDIWTDNANDQRRYACGGRTWFVATSGHDLHDGNSWNTPFATVTRGLSAAGGADDVVLLRAGAYFAPSVLSKPSTLCAAYGEVYLVKQPW